LTAPTRGGVPFAYNKSAADSLRFRRPGKKMSNIGTHPTTTLRRPLARKMPWRAAFVLCLLARTGAALLAKWAPRHWLPWMGTLALLPAAGFFSIYAMGWRQTGVEVGGGRIWWNDLRPVHGALYLAFAVLALRRSALAYVPLALDVVVGLIAYLGHYCPRGDRRRQS
jgi:hypothetical protein